MNNYNSNAGLKNTTFNRGFSLIELMIVIAIIGVLAGIAIPSYKSYVTTSQIGVSLDNAESMAGFQRTYYYEYDTFVKGSYNSSTGAETNSIRSKLDWDPKGDKGQYSYKAVPCGSGIKKCVDITATYLLASGISKTVTLSY